MASITHDPVNHPQHYASSASGVECIDISEHLGFALGNAFKYVWRHRDKRVPAQDLDKSLWYLHRYCESRREGMAPIVFTAELRARIAGLLVQVAKHEDPTVAHILQSLVTLATCESHLLLEDGEAVLEAMITNLRARYV